MNYNNNLNFPITYENNLYYKNNPQKFLMLKTLIEQHFKCGQYSHMLKRKKYTDLYKWIILQTPQLQMHNYNIPTMCYWIIHDLHEFPKCQNCGKSLTMNIFNFRDGYQIFCCNLCQITSKQFKEQRILTWRKNFNDDTITSPAQVKGVQLKASQTCMKNYGVKNPMQSKTILGKMQNTKQNKYGNKSYVNPQKAKQTKLKKYGNENYQNTEKTRQTCQDKYGVDNFAQSPLYKQVRKQHSLEKYGVDDPNQAEIIKKHQVEGVQKKYGKQYINAYQVPSIRKKIEAQRSEMIIKGNETKRRNGTFNISKPEEECYHMLHFIYPHIIRQYQSEKYPFACDFYDPISDTYFEFNGTWTHGGHFFDENCKEDQQIVEKWKSKGTKFYLNALDTWTVRDVKKRKTAIENNLSYVVFWNINEARDYVLKKADEIQFPHS